MPLSASLATLSLDALLLVGTLLAPFVAFAVVIHWLEHLMFVRLATRFGWKVVLWTGWLGTPIHELSHALMCKLFNHRIDEIALFEPDLQSGRLGFVKHSFRRGNWFQELGNFFIGVAPLIGGSLALAVLLWLFYPNAAAAAIAATTSEEPFNVVTQITDTTIAILAEIATLQNLVSLRFWAFVYLVLCVGGHMAPSRSDYRGSTKGVLMVLGCLLAVSFAMALLQYDLTAVAGQMSSLLSPLFALFVLTIVLCALATGLVFLLTSFIPHDRYRTVR